MPNCWLKVKQEIIKQRKNGRKQLASLSLCVWRHFDIISFRSYIQLRPGSHIRAQHHSFVVWSPERNQRVIEIEVCTKFLFNSTKIMKRMSSTLLIENSQAVIQILYYKMCGVLVHRFLWSFNYGPRWPLFLWSNEKAFFFYFTISRWSHSISDRFNERDSNRLIRSPNADTLTNHKFGFRTLIINV